MPNCGPAGPCGCASLALSGSYAAARIRTLEGTKPTGVFSFNKLSKPVPFGHSGTAANEMNGRDGWSTTVDRCWHGRRVRRTFILLYIGNEE